MTDREGVGESGINIPCVGVKRVTYILTRDPSVSAQKAGLRKVPSESDAVYPGGVDEEKRFKVHQTAREMKTTLLLAPLFPAVFDSIGI